MSKTKKARYNMIMSLTLVFAMVMNIMPVSALNLDNYVTKQTQEITEDELNSNKYETYYYDENVKYTHNGNIVEFISDKEIQVDGEVLKLKNKKVNINKSIKENEVTINFENLDIPVYMVSGQWNSSFEGDYRIVYETDIKGQEVIKSDSKNLKTLVISDLAPGEYNLTNGTIYEKANDYSPGIEGIGTEGNFGTLPNIVINVSEDTSSANNVKISIEKRTIGKGDTLSLQSVDFTEGDTAWDVLQKVSTENNISIEHTGNGDNLYVSSIDNDGEFDHGSGSGWKYEVNGEFPSVGLDSYTVKSGDVIRLRYCMTVGSEELNNPLVKYLSKIVDDAINTLNEGNYTTESKSNLQKAIDESKIIINDEKYNSEETDIELVVSEHIGKVNLAISKLVESDDETDEGTNEIPKDFENDLWLQYDFKEMKVGETASIYPRRIPQIINDVISNGVHRPNFNFEIVKGDSIELSTNDSTTKSMAKAIKEGTTVVKVTYDETTFNGRTYGKSSVINTAYVVFNVSNNDNNIKISTDINYDSYDTVYFTEGDSTDLIFNVSTENADNVVVTVNDEIITKNGNSYTAKLKNKSNIIGVKATNNAGETKEYYKVVDARKIEIDIKNKTNPGKKLGAGDTARISFKGIANPVAKLATIYNPTWVSSWDDTKGTFVEYQNDSVGTVKGYCSQWDLATKNTIEVKFDEQGTYDFSNGKIFSEWWGSPLGEDKEMEGEGNPNLGAKTYSRYFSQMPNFSVEVGEKNADIKVSGISLNQTTLELNEGSSFKIGATVSPENATNKNVIWSSSNEEIVKVDENGNLTGLKDGVSTITAITEDGGFKGSCVVTVIAKEVVELKALINEVEKLNKDKYTKESWEVVAKSLEKAKAVLNNENSTTNELIKAKEELQNAKNNLVFDTWAYTVEPSVITPGDEVTITIPDVPMPSLLPMSVLIQSVYNTDIEGLSTVTSKNANYGEELLKTIKFTVPKTTKPGTYNMTNGHVYVRSAQFGSKKDFVDKMPEIEINVTENSYVTNGIKQASDYVIKNVKNPGYTDEWNILGLSRGNAEVPKDYYKTYYNNLSDVVKEKKGELHRSKYTEYSRVIITLTSLGYDPTDVAGYNLVEKLYDFKNVSKQGINGVIFALIALDTKGFEIEDELNSRDMMINYILEKQLEDGGFSLGTDEGEVDITAMAIQALSKYKDNEDVKASIDKALNFLANVQLENGGFATNEGENSESTAQVLVALNSLGMNANDKMFVKNNNDIVDVLKAFEAESGGYKHLLDDTDANSMATEQVLYALVSEERLSNNKTSLYDMSDVKEQTNPEEDDDEDTTNPGDGNGNGGNGNDGNGNGGDDNNGGDVVDPDEDNDNNEDNNEDDKDEEDKEDNNNEGSTINPDNNDDNTTDEDKENPKTYDSSILPLILMLVSSMTLIIALNRKKLS